MPSSDQQWAGQSDQATAARATEALEFHLKFAALKLDKSIRQIEADGKLVQIQCDRLKTANSLNVCGSGRAAKICDRTIWLAFEVLSLYIAMKFIYLCVMHMKHDHLAEKIRQTIELPLASLAALNPDDYCRFTFALNNGSSIGAQHLMESGDFKELIELSDKLDRLGSPIRSPIGFNIVGFIYGSLMMLTLCQLGLFWSWFYEPQVGAFNFVADVRGERAKFKLQLRQLINSLFAATPSKNERIIAGKRRFVYVQSSSNIDQRTICRCHKQYCFDRTNDHQRERDEILFEEKLHNMLEPVHLCGWWHKGLCKTLTMLPTLRILLVVPATTAFFVGPLMDLIDLTHMRLGAVRCQVAIENNYQTELSGLRMKALESTDDLQLYRDFDGSWPAMLALLWTEAKLLTTWPVLITFCEATFTYAVGAISIPVYWTAYIHEYATKMIWFVEIERQINDCLSGLIEDVTIKALQNNNKMDPAGERQIQLRRNENLKRLTLAYLNFELFRREQKAYQVMSDFLIMSEVLFNSGSLVIHYYLFTVANGSTSNNLTMSLAFYVTLLSNVHLLSCAIRTTKAFKLMKNIYRLAALSVDSSLRLSPIVNLWTAQLLTKSETESYFAPRLFGLSVSFDRILTVNIYWITLWFIRKS